MKAKDKIAMAVTNRFTEALAERFGAKFGTGIRTDWSIFDFCYVTTRSDGKPFSLEESLFISGFEAGHAEAVNTIRSAA